MPPKPEPGRPLLIISLLMLGIFTCVVADSLATVIIPLRGSDGAYRGALCCLPMGLIGCILIFLSAFRSNLLATGIVTIAYFALACLGLLATIVSVVEGKPSGRSPVTFAVAGLGFSGLVGWGWLLSVQWLRKLEAWARAQDRSMNCKGCGYNLTGLPEVHRCPECGLAYDRRSGNTVS